MIKMSNSFFISNTTTKFKIIFSTIGAVILLASLLVLNRYRFDLRLDVEFDILYLAILIALISTMGVVLGAIMILCHLNYKNKVIQLLLFLLIGIFIGISIYNNLTRIFFVVLIIDVAILLIVVLLFKLYSTVTTMMVTSFTYLNIVLIISVFVFRVYPELELNPSSVFYIMTTLFLVTYRLVGVRVNRFFISYVMGQKKIKEEYTNEILISHINLIYIVIFILINASGLIYKSGEYNFFNVLNNCFITALAINQINWRTIKF